MSEISHLFLSELRSAAGHGRQPPKRIGPGQRKTDQPPAAPSFEATQEDLAGDAPADFLIPPVSAVIGARLGGTLLERASQYASGLAQELPVGLLVVEPECLRVITVTQGEDEEEPASAEVLDDIALRSVLLEMSCDVAQWLVVLPDPRLPQARRLLAGIREWVLLVPADHEGVVSGYRVLKGLCDLELPTEAADAPRVTLAFVDASDAREAKRHARRLVGVCKQFLDLDVETADVDGGPPAGAVSSIGEFAAREVGVAPWIDAKDSTVATALQAVLTSSVIAEDAMRPEKSALQRAEATDDPLFDPGQTSSPQTQALSSSIPPMARPVPTSGLFADDWVSANEDLLRLERRAETRKAPEPTMLSPARRKHILDLEIPELALPLSQATERPVALEDVMTPASTQDSSPPAPRAAYVGPQISLAPTSRPARPPAVAPAPPSRAAHAAHIDDVVDLPAGRDVAGAVSDRLALAQTPISPPMLSSSSLCVSRDGGIVLVAAAAPGLEDLPTIGRALTWASENRPLLRMALTQYRLDESRDVQLHLLVSRADVNAETLRPLLATGHVTVQAYRRLNWGGRAGLLLEAA